VTRLFFILLIAQLFKSSFRFEYSVNLKNASPLQVNCNKNDRFYFAILTLNSEVIEANYVRVNN